MASTHSLHDAMVDIGKLQFTINAMNVTAPHVQVISLLSLCRSAKGLPHLERWRALAFVEMMGQRRWVRKHGHPVQNESGSIPPLGCGAVAPVVGAA